MQVSICFLQSLLLLSIYRWPSYWFAASDWVTAAGYGVLGWVSMPLWGQLILGLLLMDLISAWFVHWLEHQVPFMWKFHIIHHADQKVDVTTGNRHHPGESVFRFVFTIIATLIVGAPMWLIFAYQTLSVVMTQFNHANIRLPQWIEKPLGWIWVTPGIHHVHHHYRMPYSDQNFGNIFSIWDRIFGTFVQVDNTRLVYGLDTHMDKKESSHIGALLKIPFQPYRNRITYTEEGKL